LYLLFLDKFKYFLVKCKGFLWSAPSGQALVSGSFGGLSSIRMINTALGFCTGLIIWLSMVFLSTPYVMQNDGEESPWRYSLAFIRWFLAWYKGALIRSCLHQSGLKILTYSLFQMRFANIRNSGSNKIYREQQYV
jgi:hypothetical protein